MGWILFYSIFQLKLFGSNEILKIYSSKLKKIAEQFYSANCFIAPLPGLESEVLPCWSLFPDLDVSVAELFGLGSTKRNDVTKYDQWPVL